MPPLRAKHNLGVVPLWAVDEPWPIQGGVRRIARGGKWTVPTCLHKMRAELETFPIPAPAQLL